MSQPKEKNIIASLIKVMIWIAVLAIAYVILKSCSTPKLGLAEFREGSLSKLEIMQEPPQLPQTVFVDADGADISLSDMRDKVILLNLWATWCAPCVAEIPSLNALQGRYDKAQFEVVAVSLDRSADDAREFLDTVGADNLALYHDMSFAIAKDAQAKGVPVSVLYDQGGRELARLSGEADWNSEEAVALINHALGQ